MNDCYLILNKNFPDINIKYHAMFDIITIKYANIMDQVKDLKKVVKTLIFKIQSKEIKKGSIVFEISDKDFLDDNILKLLNIMKFTKTSHYFNFIIKKISISDDEINKRIDFITKNYVGLNINDGMSYNREGDSYARL